MRRRDLLKFAAGGAVATILSVALASNAAASPDMPQVEDDDVDALLRKMAGDRQDDLELTDAELALLDEAVADGVLEVRPAD